MQVRAAKEWGKPGTLRMGWRYRCSFRTKSKKARVMLAYEFYPHIMGSHSVSRGVASSQFCFKTVTKAAMYAIEDLRFFLGSYASSCFASQHSLSQVPPNPQRHLPRGGHFLASTGWLRVGHKQQLTWACPTAPPKRPQIQHTW